MKIISLHHMSCVLNADGVFDRRLEYWPPSLAATMYSRVLLDNVDLGRQLGLMGKGR